MQQGFARTCIPHVERIARLHYRPGREVPVDQRGDRAHAHRGRDVAGFQVAEQRVHEHAVADFDRQLDEILMRTMHRVARLESGNARPAQALELGARLRGRHEKRAVFCLEAAVGEHFHRSGEVDLGLLHHHAHAGMLGIGGAEHRLALVQLVDAVFLADSHGGEWLIGFRIGERDTVRDAD